jgi:hypothetical protein
MSGAGCFDIRGGGQLETGTKGRTETNVERRYFGKGYEEDPWP